MFNTERRFYAVLGTPSFVLGNQKTNIKVKVIKIKSFGYKKPLQNKKASNTEILLTHQNYQHRRWGKVFFPPYAH